ncbi:MAG: LLM class F420-dependent oxidoreductase [Dehalococcoidia bacterium]
MKLAISLGYSGANMAMPVKYVQEAEAMGYDSVWTAEAYGSDAITPLAYLAAVTKKIRLGTSIMQVPARTPAMCAMTMATLDALSGGRAICGLGLSGPQVVEGWHGVPYGKPNARLREYVAILRAIWAREKPVEFHGQEYNLPYTGPGATGLGKPLKSILHPNQVPIYIASLGPANIRLTAEIADGWIPAWFSPYHMDVFKKDLEAGWAKAGKSGKDFEILGGGSVQITTDVKSALQKVKPGAALYIGGMGAKEKNFYNELFIKYGYADEAKYIQELYLSGRKAEAAEAIPDEFADEISLIGPADRIRERFKVWQDCGITTFRVGSNDPEALRLMADITGASKGGTD